MNNEHFVRRHAVPRHERAERPRRRHERRGSERRARALARPVTTHVEETLLSWALRQHLIPLVVRLIFDLIFCLQALRATSVRTMNDHRSDLTVLIRDNRAVSA